MILVVIGTQVFAQQTPPQKPSPEMQKQRKEKMEAMKVGFISEKLQLTTAEAEKFWPVYNEFESKRTELRKKMFGDDPKRQEIDAMNDKEVETRIDNEIALRQQETELFKEYNEKFKTVLPVKKVAKLYEAEREFRMQVVKKRMENQHQRQNKKPHMNNNGGNNSGK